MKRCMLVAGILLGSAWPAGGRGVAPQQEAQPLPKLERLSAWPVLDRSMESEVKRAVDKLQVASSESMAEEGRMQLLSHGGAAAPALLRALGKEQNPAARARMISVLEKLTDARHTRLLTPFFTHKSLEFRHWALRRVASFPDQGTEKEALAALEKALHPGKKKQPDADEVYVSALAAAAAGSLSALEHLIPRGQQAWKLEAEALGTALGALRGPLASEFLVPMLKSMERKERLVALRFLGAAGTKEHCVQALLPFLDEQDSELLIAAINALRSTVDGLAPLPKLSAFDAIGIAKEWKNKL